MARSNRTAVWCCILILMTTLVLLQPVYADEERESNEEIARFQSLLEKGLSLFEMERELERIQAKLSQIDVSMRQNKERMEQLQEEIAINHERAGEVLRQYYMGERLDFISILLNVRSIAQFVAVFDWIEILLDSDKKHLTLYQESLAEERHLLAELETEQSLWLQLEQNYSTELERVRTLQVELDRELEALANAEAVAAEITRLTEEWQQVGLPWFHTYFQALASAIVHLPDWIMNSGHALSFEREHIAVHLTDDDLNSFLLAQNVLFQGFHFHFEEEQIVVEGERDGMNLKLIGRYVHEYSEESGNMLDFKIDQLYYNEFKLPEATGNDLKEQFDLRFYPDKMSPFLRFKDFAQAEGKLMIYLQL